MSRLAGVFLAVWWLGFGLVGMLTVAGWLTMPTTIRYAATTPSIGPIGEGTRIGVQIGYLSAPKVRVRRSGMGKAAVSVPAWPPICRRVRVQVRDGKFPVVRWSPKGCETAGRT